MDDHDFMQEALKQAQLAALANEVPVGAVLVEDQTIIAYGHNAPISHCDPTAHAEIQVLRDGALFKKNYRLPEATLYVTLEPCAMCFGAMIHARIKRLVYAASEPKAGFFSMQMPCTHFNHTVAVSAGILGHEASEILKRFFMAKRRK